MHIREVTVSAGITAPHPTKPYTILRAGVELTVTLETGDSYPEVLSSIQAECRSGAAQQLTLLMKE